MTVGTTSLSFAVADISGLVVTLTAGTGLTWFDGDPQAIDFLRYDVVNIAHYIRPGASGRLTGKLDSVRRRLDAPSAEQP